MASRRTYRRRRQLRRLRSRRRAQLARLQAPLHPEWWTWWPAAEDLPGAYDPTIVVHHGGPAGRTLPYQGIAVRDTARFRTPAFWRAVRPDVTIQLMSYPNGYLGQHTARRRTRDYDVLGTWHPSDPAPAFPVGIPVPLPATITVIVAGLGELVAELRTDTATPTYTVSSEQVLAARSRNVARLRVRS